MYIITRYYDENSRCVYEALHYRYRYNMESLFVDKLENPFVTANVDKTANVMSGTTYNNVFRKFFVKLISRKITHFWVLFLKNNETLIFWETYSE